uniref:Zinc finger protein 782 n=1 Tax=Molossus molossus TaxID=27622 RepID=A0A7J8EI15_MOLMO|nr:zinc finger protein 782 [Molossus molossus]
MPEGTEGGGVRWKKGSDVESGWNGWRLGTLKRKDVTVEFTQEEWRQTDSAQRTLYRDVTWRTAATSFHWALLYQTRRISTLEQGEDPCFEGRHLSRSPEKPRLDGVSEKSAEIQGQQLWKVSFTNKSLTTEQDVPGKPRHLDRNVFPAGTAACRFDTTRPLTCVSAHWPHTVNIQGRRLVRLLCVRSGSLVSRTAELILQRSLLFTVKMETPLVRKMKLFSIRQFGLCGWLLNITNVGKLSLKKLPSLHPIAPTQK